MSSIIRSDFTNGNILDSIQTYFPAYEHCTYCFYRPRTLECICLAEDDDEDQNCAFCNDPTLCQECCSDGKPTTREIMENLLTELYLSHGFGALKDIGEKITNSLMSKINPYDIVLVKLLNDIKEYILEYSESGFIAKIQKLLENGASDPADMDFLIYNPNYTLLQNILRQEKFSYPLTGLLIEHSKNRQGLLNQKNKWGFTTLGNEIFQLIRSDYNSERDNHWEKIFLLLDFSAKLENESLNFSGCTGCNYLGPLYISRREDVKRLVDLGVWFDLDQDIGTSAKKLRETRLGKFLIEEYGVILQKIKETYSHICENWKEEYYEKCKKQWEQIQQKIVHYPSNGARCKCGTLWSEEKYISLLIEETGERVCAVCDRHSQPYLANPRNRKYVEKYISKELPKRLGWYD